MGGSSRLWSVLLACCGPAPHLPWRPSSPVAACERINPVGLVVSPPDLAGAATPRELTLSYALIKPVYNAGINGGLIAVPGR